MPVTINLLVGETLTRYFENTPECIQDTIEQIRNGSEGWINTEQFQTQAEADAYKRGFDDGYCDPTILLTDATAKLLQDAFDAADATLRNSIQPKENKV